MKTLMKVLVIALLLGNCIAPTSTTNATQASTENVFLDELSLDTWTYLSSDWATENHLPWSWRSAVASGGDYANTAEIGFYALSWLVAHDMQATWSPDWPQTEGEVGAILDQLRAWQSGSQIQQPNGPNAYAQSVFYQWYWISWSPPVVGAGTDDHLVPSVDNAWLAASLITIRAYAQAGGHTALAQKADEILADMDFMLWYHYDTHRFSWGGVEDPQGGTQADYYSNENRIINFVARALGQISAEEFQLSLAALEKPSSLYGDLLVERVNWDGSYFTYASPALFIQEQNTSYGRKTLLPVAQAQAAYAADQGYAAWGISDCYDLGGGGYVQQGAPPAASPDPLETRPGLVTPHASALALISPLAPEAAANLQSLSALSICSYDPAYGFPDSVLADPAAAEYGQCSQRFSALAQEWLFLALSNYGNGFIWNHFYLDDGVSAAHAEMYPPVFLDVPYDYWSFTWIERVYDAGLTGGCTVFPLRYCPAQSVTRAQMAVFLERGMHGNSYQPPDVPPTFNDTAGHWAEDWIEALRIDGVTGGCGDGNFCPQKTTTRAEMAVFLLRAKYGPTYAPPAASGTLFTDVPSTHWAAAWIEKLAVESISGGCGSGKYCPGTSVTRAQMAVFLVKAFELP